MKRNTLLTGIFRAQILYRQIINYPNVIFVPASSSLSEAEFSHLVENEANAVKKVFAHNS